MMFKCMRRGAVMPASWAALQGGLLPRRSWTEELDSAWSPGRDWERKETHQRGLFFCWVWLSKDPHLNSEVLFPGPFFKISK